MMFFILLPSFIIFLVGFVRTVKAYVNFLDSKKLIKTNLNSNENEPFTDFFLLLPAHFEQSIVNETLETFSNLDYDKSHFNIIIITSQAENNKLKNKRKYVKGIAVKIWKNPDSILDYNNGLFPHLLLSEVTKIASEESNFDDFEAKLLKLYDSIPTTYQLVQKWIANNSKLSNLILLDDPNESSTKTDKLNFALNYIKNNIKIKNDTYIGVYDFDSKPDFRTLKYINSEILKGKTPFVFQQIPLVVRESKTFKTISNLEKNLLLSYSLLHLRRSFGVEYGMHKNSNNLILKYCLGAGMYLNAEKLIELQGFPKTSDDIPIGYRSSFLNLETIVVPLFNLVTINTKLNSIFGQTRNIFWSITYGMIEETRWLFQNEQRHIDVFSGILKMVLTLIYQYGIAIIVFWQFMSILYSIASFNTLAIVLSLLFTFFGYLPTALFAVYILSQLKEKNFYSGLKDDISNPNLLTLVVFSIFKCYLKTIFIINSIIKNFDLWTNGGQVVQTKSER